jgi:hypothetical protein
VIGDPLVIGSDQVKETLSLTLAVATVVGESGTKAQSSVMIDEAAE